jgi:hypothetical protein
MPLDSRKIAHIKAKIALINLGRTQPICWVLKNADGSTTTHTVDTLWGPAQDADPTLGTPQSGTLAVGTSDDVLASVQGADLSLAQLRACIYAYPQSALDDEPASRYIITTITPKGMMTGGDRYVVTLTRQR